MRTYSELISLPGFKERFKYLELTGVVAKETFGYERYLNQRFYKSIVWKRARDQIILRDMGCDLACADNPIYGKIIIHHMNPINIDDLRNQTEELLNPEYLVCVSVDTHNAIHYGGEKMLEHQMPAERKENDTCPWKKAY